MCLLREKCHIIDVNVILVDKYDIVCAILLNR